MTVSLGRRLVQWTIIDIQRKDMTFQTLFSKVKTGKFDCIEVIDELKRATLLQVLVGRDRDKLLWSLVQASRFVVYARNEKLVMRRRHLSSRNAFSVMFAAQRQLQESENGVPCSIPVNTNKCTMI